MKKIALILFAVLFLVSGFAKIGKTMGMDMDGGYYSPTGLGGGPDLSSTQAYNEIEAKNAEKSGDYEKAQAIRDAAVAGTVSGSSLVTYSGTKSAQTLVTCDSIRNATGGETINTKLNLATFTSVLTTFTSVNDGCWYCGVFSTLYSVADKMADSLYGTLCSFALILLGLGGFAWILLIVWRFITTTNSPNVGEFMGKIFISLGCLMFGAIILTHGQKLVTDMVVDVPAATAVTIGNKIINLNGNNDTASITVYSGKAGCWVSERRVFQVCKQPTENYKILGKDLYYALSCLLRRVCFETIVGMAVGATFITSGFNDTSWGIPNVGMTFAGLLLFFAYFMIFIQVPFKMIDIVLRMCFVLILLPIFILCAVFPVTRGYSKKAWGMYLSCLITFVSLAIFIALAIVLLSEALVS